MSVQAALKAHKQWMGGPKGSLSLSLCRSVGDWPVARHGVRICPSTVAHSAQTQDLIPADLCLSYAVTLHKGCRAPSPHRPQTISNYDDFTAQVNIHHTWTLRHWGAVTFPYLAQLFPRMSAEPRRPDVLKRARGAKAKLPRKSLRRTTS